MRDVGRNTVVMGSQPTSRSAAERMYFESGTWRKNIYNFVADQKFDGATDQEMQEFFNKSGDTIRPARSSLVKDNILMDSGRTRENAAGNPCIIWVVVDFEGMLM